jgi:biopolymer transport protein ExbD
MIDMVCLLLIFFLVASTVIDNKVPVEIPSAAYSKVPDNIEGRVVLSVNKDGKMFVGQMPVTEEQLKEQLKIQIEADPNLRVLIRSGKNVKYKYNEKIMEICAEVGATDLIYAAFEE